MLLSTRRIFTRGVYNVYPETFIQLTTSGALKQLQVFIVAINTVHFEHLLEQPIVAEERRRACASPAMQDLFEVCDEAFPQFTDTLGVHRLYVRL